MGDSIHAAGPASPEPVVLVDRDTAAMQIKAALDAAFESDAPGVYLLRPTTGSGKSHHLREAIVRHAARRGVLLVPNHALADQHQQLLGLPPEQVFVARGITGTKINGRPACVQHEQASRLVRLGMDASRLCAACPHAVAYQRTADPCPAAAGHGASAPEKVRLRIAQSARAAEVIVAAARGLDVARDGADHDGSDDDEADEDDDDVEVAPAATTRPILMIDEPPSVVRVEPLPSAASVRRLLVALQPAVREMIEPIVEAVLARKDDANCRTLGECLRAELPDAQIEPSRRDAYGVELVLGSDGQRSVLGVVASGGSRVDDELYRARNAIEVIREACSIPERVLLHREGGQVYVVARAAWVREVRRWVRQGGSVVILDATADPSEYRACGIGSKPREGVPSVRMHVTDVHVRDTEGSRRIVYKWASGPRTRHVKNGDQVVWSEMQGVLRHLAELTNEQGGPLGVIADAPTARAIDNEWKRVAADPTAVSEMPAEFVALARAGVELRIGWYGANRGLDRWKGVRVHACIGDPFPPVAHSGAVAAFLSRNPFEVGYRIAQCEIQQSVGRSRSVRYPVTIVHYGSRGPHMGMAPQWRDATIVEAKKGKPKRKDGALARTGADLERERLALGMSKRAHAKHLGISTATYMDRTRAAAAS